MLADSTGLPPLVLDRPRAQKLQNSIKSLDPTNKLAINDWLIALRAACGYPFVDCFKPVVKREDFRASCGYSGAHLDRYPESAWDDLYAQHLELQQELETALFGFIIPYYA